MPEITPANKTHPITWEEMHRDARMLAAVLLQQPGPPFTHVIAIAKGGLVPAMIVAREMAISSVEVINARSYGTQSLATEQEQRAVQIDPFPDTLADGFPLVIDDLIDSGKTMQAVFELLTYTNPGYQGRHAVLYCKGHQSRNLITYGRWFPANLWLLMPWDMAPQYKAPLNSQQVELNVAPPRNIDDP